MVFDNLKQDISQISEGTEHYVKTTKEYYKLRLFKVFMKTISSLMKLALVAFIFFLALVILSFAVVYSIEKLFNSLLYSYLIVGLFYVAAGLFIYLFRKRIDKPILRKFSEYYFEQL